MTVEFIDENIFSIITSLQQFFTKYYGHFVSIGQAIGGVLCLVVVAKEAFQMMQLQKGIDVLALFRPILIALVLANWSSFTLALRQPFMGSGVSVESWARNTVYKKELAMVDLLHEKRWELQLRQYEVLQNARAKAEVAEEAVKEDKNVLSQMYDNVKDLFAKASDVFKSLWNIKNTWFVFLFEKLIGFLTQLIWAYSVFFTFFVREIGIGILTITGPISFGMSVLPIWKDTWASWVTRYVSYCLYGFVAYFIMAAALQLFKYGIEVDIQRLSTPEILLTDWANFNGMYSLVGALVGGLGLRMVPEIVTWIVPSNSGMAISHFINGASDAGKKTVATVGKAVAAAV